MHRSSCEGALIASATYPGESQERRKAIMSVASRNNYSRTTAAALAIGALLTGSSLAQVNTATTPTQTANPTAGATTSGNTPATTAGNTATGNTTAGALANTALPSNAA